jgi:hypothetical protein
MKKRNKIFLALILFIFIGIGLYLERKQKSQISTGPPKIPVSDKDKITVSNVEVENFTKDAEVVSRGETYLLEENQDFHIIARKKEGQFLISILGAPFSEKRARAEDAFVKKLGITREEACKLNVVITTPAFANKAEAGKNYPLSFCE